MKTGMSFKYIEFRVAGQKPKTTVWDILNKNSGDRIGQVRWYANWRQYCFLPDEECVFSVGCLQDIIMFIQTEMSKRKNTGVAE